MTVPIRTTYSVEADVARKGESTRLKRRACIRRVDLHPTSTVKHVSTRTQEDKRVDQETPAPIRTIHHVEAGAARA
jgi:hypothetical protein